jgi:hypothetical protein
MFPSQEEALNWVYSFTPHNGNYYRVRACAYPVGVYGIHWVCHQNVNAFSSRRWNTILLDNPISMLVFGPLGNFASPLTGSFPVSREKCPILGCSKQERFGGVPGKGLHYQQPPFFADWAMHNLTESNMENGAGFNLDRCYIPGQDRNVPTKAHYTQRELLTFDDADDALCQPPVFVSGWV